MLNYNFNFYIIRSNYHNSIDSFIEVDLFSSYTNGFIRISYKNYKCNELDLINNIRKTIKEEDILKWLRKKS